MSELAKDFEKEFPLPWKMQRRGTWEYINAENGSGLGICIIPATDFEPKKAARQYLVQCANLMPHVIDKLNEMDACGLVDEIIDGIEDAGVIGGREVAE